MERNPIACTLSSVDRATRGEEWRQFLNAGVLEIVRSETSARLRLIDSEKVLVAAADLARREKECCAFFEFRLELLPEAVWLEMTVPKEAAATLDVLINR